MKKVQVAYYEAGNSYQVNKYFYLYDADNNKICTYSLNWDGCMKEFSEEEWRESEREKVICIADKCNASIGDKLVDDILNDVISVLSIKGII